MVGFFGKIGASFTGMWHISEGLNMKSIRPAKLYYALAYVFELIFYTYHKTFLHVDSKLFGIDADMLMYIGHILMSLIIMLLWSNKFRPLIYISVVITVAGFLAFFFVSGGIPKLLCAVLAMTGLGGCVTAARCGFAFAANNAERLLGVVLLLGGRAALDLLDAAFPDGTIGDDMVFLYVYPAITLAGMVFCLLRFKEGDLEFKETSTPEDRKGLYWALAIFITFFALEGYRRFMLGAGSAYNVFINGMGTLVTIVLLVLIMRIKRNIWHAWNLFLVVAISMALLPNIVDHPMVDTALSFLDGLHLIGWAIVLYILACAQRRFASLKLLKQCTIVFVIVSPLTTLSDEVVQMLFPEQGKMAALVYTLVIAVMYILASPYIHKYLFSAIWIGDLQKKDMALLRDKVEGADRFEHYGLTPREKEVAALLLAANTVRMIAGELKLSQSTVNMHTSNLYKKLGINSKAELFKKIGVAEESDAES